jgi:hypothetical protein
MRCVLAGVLLLASCHLADDPESPKCAPGSHAENGRCQGNLVADALATIGKGCTIEPSTLVVKARTDFMFDNQDDVAHVVTLMNGKLVEEIAPGQTSRFIQISAAGSFPYEVSGCPSGGTIAVE